MLVSVIDEVEETLTASLQSFLDSKESDFCSLLRQFHNVFAKRIRPQPRSAHLSHEIQRHPLFLNEKREVIEQIVSDIEAGVDLTKYLSERTEQLAHYDKSLAHFGVHHFHLGEVLQTAGARIGRVKGTKCLLFARVLDEDVYLLDILGHGLRAGFLNVHLMRVMHRNWPESIENYRIEGAIGLARKYADHEAAELLEKDVNVILELGPSQVFMLPGMGTTTAGTPALVETRTNRTISTFREILSFVRHNSSAVAGGITRITAIGYNTIRLQGRVRVGLLEIYDARSGCAFLLEGDHLVISIPDEF